LNLISKAIIMQYRIIRPKDEINGSVKLPSSKSISNRLLIIRALSGGNMQINNLSESEDTRVMEEAFRLKKPVINIGHAGTAMRFLTSYLSICPGEWILTGSERMKKRPIGKLVDALRQLGANIEYREKQGYPPLKINGKVLNGDFVEIDGNISSQFVSSLLMIAPVLPNGLTVKLKNEVISSSYISLTLGLMKKCGIQSCWSGNQIEIAAQKYIPSEITVEVDWSAASYWYEVVSLSEQARIAVKGLDKESLQGDAAIFPLFKILGVSTEFTNEGAILRKIKSDIKSFEYNFIDIPDMVQSFAVALSLLAVPFKFTGCKSLKIKETDRIKALQNELAKLGVKLKYDNAGLLYRDGRDSLKLNQIPVFPTYQDHRMAMAFAPVCLRTGEVIIEDPAVVTKSYPSYWEELKKIGFEVISS
jgi:3-phosphoshikimate 1-carboxyvinyltransferase